MTIPSVALGQDIASNWGNAVADAINNMIPIGTVWMGFYPSEPDGWAFMDGREVSRTDGEWAPLYAAIGSYCGPGNGVTTWNLPNAIDRSPFCVGPTVGGLGGTGGSKDAVVVSHTHVQDAHTHVQNAHNHPGSSGSESAHTHTINHGHSLSGGTHSHAAGGTGGDRGFRFLITWGTTTNERVAGETTPGVIGNMVPTDIEPENVVTPGPEGTALAVVSHTGGSGAGSGHSHSVTVNNTTATNQNATAVNQSTGVSGTDKNMPPWLALQFVVKK